MPLPAPPDPTTHRTARARALRRALAERADAGDAAVSRWIRRAHLVGVEAAGLSLAGLELEGVDLRRADLTGADLTGVRLGGADLGGARLDEAGLDGADLRRATLDRANLRGASLVRARLGGASLVQADLSGAALTQASLRGATLLDATLVGADLRKADLVNGGGRCTELSGAVLRGADLSRANLTAARLHRTDLREARLRGTVLFGADLRETPLGGASMRSVDLSRASLHDVRDLPPELAAEARLEGATLDWRTVARLVHRDGARALLAATGMPWVSATYLVDSLRSIDAADLFTMLQSVFLSYGGPDQALADRLRAALSANGVKTWYYPVDATPGEAILTHIERELGQFDRMIVCCSRAGIVRDGVLHELEVVLRRERAEGASIVLPVLVDDIFETGPEPPTWWPPSRAEVYRTLHGRVCADLRGKPPDSEAWNDELGRILVALRRVAPPRDPPRFSPSAPDRR